MTLSFVFIILIIVILEKIHKVSKVFIEMTNHGKDWSPGKKKRRYSTSCKCYNNVQNLKGNCLPNSLIFVTSLIWQISDKNHTKYLIFKRLIFGCNEIAKFL